MKEAAPLISIPEAPVPPGADARWLVASDGVRLRCALFRPSGPSRGTVVLSSGRTEAIEKYFEVITDLLGRDFTVLTHDWRGQGLSDRLVRSDRLKGHANGWRPFIRDYSDILDAFEDEAPRPWIAMGHSMGGGLTTLALAEGEERFSAAVLSAPMIAVDSAGLNPTAVRIIAAVMSRIGLGKAYAQPPVDPLAETFQTTVLTHDEGRWMLTRRQYEACRDLLLGMVTWGWIDFALRLTDRVTRSERLRRLAIPFVVVAAAEEKLVRNDAAKAVAEAALQGRFVLVEGAYHEVLMETDPRRNQFWAEFDAVADRVAPRSAELG